MSAAHHVTWTIDQEADTPACAAAEVWRSIFGRGVTQPAADEACVFTVTGPDGSAVEVDLSEPVHAHLF